MSQYLGTCLQEFETLLRFSGAGKSQAVRGLAESTGMVPPGIVSSAQQLSDDIRLRYSASSAVTNGLEECMEEAEHGQGTDVSVALEAAVLTILHEIGEDPDREVKSQLQGPLEMQIACVLDTCIQRPSLISQPWTKYWCHIQGLL